MYIGIPSSLGAKLLHPVPPTVALGIGRFTETEQEGEKPNERGNPFDLENAKRLGQAAGVDLCRRNGSDEGYQWDVTAGNRMVRQSREGTVTAETVPKHDYRPVY